MALDSSRVHILTDLITQAGIPLVGISILNINAVPPLLELQFDNATPEQIALANQIAAGFDWRRRRVLSRNTVVAAWQALNSTQRNTVLAHLLADLLRNNVSATNAISAFLEVPLSVDEVDPT